MMQNSKTRGRISDVTQKTSPSSARLIRPGGSPRSPSSELQKKGAAKVLELEIQLGQAQLELKKTKDVLYSAEQDKRRVIQEAEAVKKQYLAVVSKLEEKQRELAELSASEAARIQELRRLSQERDRAWLSELQAVQRQSSVDAEELAAAMSEIQRLRLQLDRAQVKRVEMEEETYRRTLELSMEWVDSVVDEAGMMVMEWQVIRTVETEAAREVAERAEAESRLREAELAAALAEKDLEKEAELRSLRIQSSQWRKAAETAAAILSPGASPPYCDDDADVASPRRKNGTVLRKLGFWKKK